MKKIITLLALAMLASCASVQRPRSAAAIGPEGYASLTYSQCASEFQQCAFSGKRVVRFGAPGTYSYSVRTDGVLCSFRVLGDPLPGKTKTCAVSSVDPDAVVVPSPPPPPVDAGMCSCPCQGETDAGVPPMFDAGVPPDAGATVDSGPVVVPDAGQPSQPGTVARPSSSRGVGFFVVGSKVYDANGREFVMRGTNKTHQDFWAPGLGKTKSNTTRWIIYFTGDPDRAIRDMTSPNIGGTTVHKAVQVPGFWDGTCRSDSSSFEAMVSRWVSWAPKMQAFERYMVLNIANEWGSNEDAWRSAYVSAIPRIRAAGYHGLIMVDAPGCGQNGAAIAHHGQAILSADPERNVMFSWHIYGAVYDSQGGVTKQWQEQVDLVPTLDAIKAANVALVIGEFGPKSDGQGAIFPSPTAITPQRIVEQATARGFGFLSWSFDDNNAEGGRCIPPAFCHSYDGTYDSDADLTPWGKIMVDIWNQLAVPASIFQ